MKRLPLFVCCCLLLLLTAHGQAQMVTDPSQTQADYDLKKQRSHRHAAVPFNRQVHRSVKPFFRLQDTTCFVERDTSFIPVPRNDDGSLGPINLPFSFAFYDTSYNRVWINTNGNITFHSAYTAYTASGFPLSGVPMIAGYWEDVDTRNTSGGQIWYKVTPTYMIITWDSVGYYNSKVDLLNKFQIIIAVLNDSIVGAGNNLRLNYKDMQWASSGGFGSTASTVGANAGSGSKYIQIGRFNRGDDFYDGPGGAPDGINYLDHKCFAFDVSNFINAPPTLSGVPASPVTLNVGDSLNFTVESIAPEVGQTVVMTVNTRGMCKVDTVITNGVIGRMVTKIKADTCNIGTHLLTFTSTDNGTPVRATDRDLTIHVPKLNQSLSFTQPPDKTFGDPSFTLVASATSGLPVVFSIVSGPASVFGSTLQINGVGTITVRARQPGNSIFNAATPVERSFCVRPTTPGVMSGSVETCVGANDTYSVPNITGATYTWTLSGGGTLTPSGNTATILWDSLGTFIITVKYTSNCATTDSVRTRTVQVIPNPLTDTFINMLPSDGNMNLSLPVTFSWYPIEHATAYDLYIWQDTAPRPATPTISNITGINYTIQSTSILQYEKLYKWQLIAKRACFTLESPVQQFKLRYLPDLVVDTIQNPATAFSGQSLTVGWRIKNNGLGGTLHQQWFDAVYLSLDAVLDPGVDLFMGTRQNASELNAGASYNRSATFTLPQGLNNQYYIIVVTNPYGSLLESNTANNRGVSVSTTHVQLTPPPDLQVISIVPPNFIFSGETINLTYKVGNKGTGGTVANAWYDLLYLTQDSILNTATATFLGSHYHIGPLNVNEEYTRTQSVTIPQGIFGRYYFFVRTDMFNQVYEHASENNNTGRSDSVNILLTPPVDLIVNNIVRPDSASNKESVTLQWTVENAGGSAAGGYWTDYIYLSKLSSFSTDSSLFIASFGRPNGLNPGDAYTAQHHITIPSNITGNYYVYIRTDATNAVFEHTFENNNVTRSAQPVKIISPDLVVTNILLPASDSSGKMVNLQWKVRNGGSGTVFNTTIRDRITISRHPVYVADSVVDITTITYQTGQLQKGDSINRAAQVMLPNGFSGNYYIYIHTDFTQSVYEGLHENNNISRSAAAIQILLSPWPDLLVTQIQVADSAFADEVLPVSFTVKNNGTARAQGTWFDRIYLSVHPSFSAGDTIFLREVGQTRQLEKDSVYQVNTSIKIPASIQDSLRYYIHLYADAGNAVYEHTVEGNNTQVKDSLFVRKYPPVDLAVVSVTAPDSARSGMPIALSWSVQNIGAATTLKNQWHDGLYLSTDTAWDKTADILVGQALRTGVLGAGLSYAVTENFTIPNGTSGTFYLLLVTDHEFINNDANRKNNYKLLGGSGGSDSIKIIISLTPPPDLVVTSFAKPDQGPAGQPVMIKYTVRNNGTGSTPVNTWTDKVYLSTNLVLDGGDPMVGTKVHTGSLNPAGTYSDSFEVYLPISFSGNYVVIFKADANDNVYEHTSENNNTAQGLITIVQPPLSDLVVSSITNPVTAMAGESISLEWKVKNTGSNPAVGYMTEAVYLSEDTAKSVDDVLLASRGAYINILPQAEVTHSFTGDLTGVSLKEYHVLVHTDVVNNIFETSDNNNVAASLNKTSVGVTELVMNVLTPGTLSDNREVYYRIVIPAVLQGESMLLTLKGDSINGANEMYLRFGDVPTRAVYDFAHGQPYRGNQEIVVPELRVGTYYVMLYGETAAGSTQSITLLAKLLQFEVRSVDANTGGNTGKVTVLVNGSKLSDVTEVILRRGSTTISADSIMVVDPTKLYVRFNLVGAALGTYDVVARKAGGDSAVLVNGFTVVAGAAPNLLTNVLTPPSTRPSTVISLFVEFTNAGNTDLVNPLLRLSSLGGAPIAFDINGLSQNVKELTLPLREVNGPAGILRPGARGTIIVYAKATTALGFTLFQSQ